MNTTNRIYLAFIQVVKCVCSIPKTIAIASRKRQRQAVLNEHEAERLDRICNPSKYRGK